MSICEIAIFAILGFFAVAGLLIGLIKGAVKAVLRVILVGGCIFAAVYFNRQITDFIFAFEINGASIKDTLMGLINIEGTGVDPAKIQELLWPIIFLVSQIVVCLVSVVALLAASWIVELIFDLILNAILKGKKKFRLIGMVIGLLAGGAVGLSVTSLVTGLAPNIYQIYKLEIGDTKVSDLIPVPSDVIESSGIANFNAENGGIAYKIGSIANPLIYDRVSKAEIDGKEYTFDGQISVIKKCADLAGTFSKLSSVDFTNPSSIEDVVGALNSIDFNNMTEEEKEAIDAVIDTVIDAVGVELPEGVVIDTETLGAVNFTAIGEVVEVVADIQNGGTVQQEQVTEILGGFLEKKEGSDQNTVDVIASFGVDISSYSSDPTASAMFTTAIDDLASQVDSTTGDNVYSEDDINALKELFFGSAA